VTPRLVSKVGDLSSLAKIHATSFAEPWTERAIDELLASPGSLAFCAEDGFVLARVAADEAEILTLAVRPDRRRRGVGTSLVRAAADHASALGARYIFLEVAVGNAGATSLYTGLGFGGVGRRPAYYDSGPDKREDALILRSNLPLPPLGKRPEAG